MNDQARKNELENNVFPLIQRKRKRHGFTKEKKKKLSHENKRRLIEPPSNHWRQVRGRRASNRTIRITTHYFSFSINSSGFLILIIRKKKNKLKEHSQLSKQHKNALSYTLHTFLCRNNKNTIIIVRAARRLYYDKENSQLKFRYDQFHDTLSLHDGFRRA